MKWVGSWHFPFNEANSFPPWQIAKTVQNEKIENKGVWKRHGGFWVSSVLVAGDAGDAAALCVAGVALGDIHLRFTWQARHLATSTFVLRGRHDTYGTGWRAWVGFGRGWRRWRRGTLRGRRGTWRHPPSFHVAGAAFGDIYLRLAWHLWHWVARSGRFWSRLTPVTPRHFAWQAWHLATSTFVSRGRRSTWRHLPSFCVAGVALYGTGWRAWVGFGRGWRRWRRWRRGTLRGRRGTHDPSFVTNKHTHTHARTHTHTHHFHTHHLSHTTLSHTHMIFLRHTQSFT